MSPEERLENARHAVDAILKLYGCWLVTESSAEWTNGQNGTQTLIAKVVPNQVRLLPNWVPPDEPLPIWNDYINKLLGDIDGR